MKSLGVTVFILVIASFIAHAVQAQAPGQSQPNAAGSSYDRGVALYNNKKFSEALGQFEAADIPANQAANAAYYRALCYHQMGKLKEAILAYKFVVTKYSQTTVAQNAIKTLIKLDPSVRKAVENNPLNKGIDWTGLPDEVEIPYKKGFGGHMFVHAQINGAPVTMLFDTGAEPTMCPQSYLNQHGVVVHRTSSGGSMKGVGGEAQFYVAIAEVQLGQLKRQMAIMVEEDEAAMLNNNASSMRVPLLGQSFFKDVPYEIDDAQHMIIFKKPAAKGGVAIHSSDREVPFFREGEHIIIRPKINGRECEMILDTGAQTVAFADRHLAQCGLNRPVAAARGKSGGVGGVREGFEFYIDSIVLGPIERRNVPAQMILNSNFPKPLLGQSFLNGLRYTIDPVRNVIRFE